jgi:hypothetical protein
LGNVHAAKGGHGREFNHVLTVSESTQSRRYNSHSRRRIRTPRCWNRLSGIWAETSSSRSFTTGVESTGDGRQSRPWGGKSGSGRPYPRSGQHVGRVRWW